MNGLTEKEIAKIWQYQLLDTERLVTEEGAPLQIIYPGWLNDDRGPDFKDAVILGGRGLIRGDIEVHVRSSSWWEHGHHLDALYNNVILHVVMWHGAGATTELQNGGQAPTLALSKYIRIPLSQWSEMDSMAGARRPCRCAAGGVNNEALAGFLDGAGEERFHIKAAGFQKDIVNTEDSQVLYQGVMGALGYSRNKLPFLELARRLPLRVLELAGRVPLRLPESRGRDKAPDTEWLLSRQAMLLGTAGLLAGQPQDGRGNQPDKEWRDRLVRLWMSLPHPDVMPPGAWHLLKVRPNNSPVFRLVAMSYLLHRYREKGFLEGLVGLVREAHLSRNVYRSLEAGLVVNADGQTLLGRGRAADIIVNVLLPFILAWSRAAAEPGLGNKALELYRLYPRLTVNSVERHMAKTLGLDSSLVNSAGRQQGLIHIYKNVCSLGGCERCPFTKTTQCDAI